MTLADRLVVLRDGEIEQIGTPLEVYNNPVSTFVAEFIGSPAMNLLDGHVEAGMLHIGESRLPVANPVTGAVRVGIRAEDISAATDGTGVEASLRYVEELGSQRLGHFHVAGHPLVASFSAGEEIRERMSLAFSASALHLFDATSGRRLD